MANTEEDIHINNAPPAVNASTSSDRRGLIGRAQNHSKLVDSDDDLEDGNLIGHSPSHRESLHMSRPTDEVLMEKDAERQAREEAMAATLNELDDSIAHNDHLREKKNNDGSTPSSNNNPPGKEESTTGTPAAVRGLRKGRETEEDIIQDDATAKKMAAQASSVAGANTFARLVTTEQSEVAATTDALYKQDCAQQQQQEEDSSSRPVLPGAVSVGRISVPQQEQQQQAAAARPSYEAYMSGGEEDNHQTDDDAAHDNSNSHSQEETPPLVVAELATNDADEQLREENENLKEELRRISEATISSRFVETVRLPQQPEEEEEPNPFDAIVEEGGSKKGNNSSVGPNKKSAERENNRKMVGIAFVILLVIIIAVVLSVTLQPKKEEEEDDGNSTKLPPDSTVVAHVPATICYEAVPLFGASQACPLQEVGSSVTNLVAASRLWNFPQVDISIVNGGAIRGDLKQGNFTVGDAKTLLPFDDTLVILHIRGKDLVVAMERGLQTLVDDYSLLEFNETMSGGPYPYGAGIRYRVNMSESFPNRLSRIEVNPGLSQEEWQPIDRTKEYSVVTNSFLASGGDGYQEFVLVASDSPEKSNDTGVPNLVAFLEYCQHIQVLTPPPLEHFSTQAYTNDNNQYNWSCHLC